MKHIHGRPPLAIDSEWLINICSLVKKVQEMYSILFVNQMNLTVLWKGKVNKFLGVLGDWAIYINNMSYFYRFWYSVGI